MAATKSSPLLLLFLFSLISPSLSLSFNLTYLRRQPNPSLSLSLSLSAASSPYDYKAGFKYTMALIVSLPIGTPPQSQQLVLDTGSQLSWVQCHQPSAAVDQKQNPPPEKTTFYPARSSSFSPLPCTHPVCKPRVPDFTLPTDCDPHRLCHYSYFYADGTLAEGNLVNEIFTFSPSQTTPRLALGCALDQTPGEGILGMNFGRLSFPSQAKISKFSYCVPTRTGSTNPTGSFYLGENPNSRSFQYTPLLSFAPGQLGPNFDPLAYTVGLSGIKIGAKRLDIPVSAFRPDAGGSGQTFLDSGTEFTFLVEEAYGKVQEEVARLVGPRMKKGYVYEQVLEMCFGGDPAEIGRLIGGVALVFDKGVEVAVDKGGVLVDAGGGVHCLGIGRSGLLGVSGTIIGNVHQQNLWVEYDLANRRIGFGRADCSRS